MSQEDVETVREAFTSPKSRGLADTATRYWDAQVEYVEDPRWPGASTYRGRDAVLRCFQSYSEALGREDDIQVTVERVVDAGNRQVPFVRVKSLASTSGVPHEHLWAYVVEVRNGRIIYFRAYYDPQEALETLGLSDARDSG